VVTSLSSEVILHFLSRFCSPKIEGDWGRRGRSCPEETLVVRYLGNGLGNSSLSFEGIFGGEQGFRGIQSLQISKEADYIIMGITSLPRL